MTLASNSTHMHSPYGTFELARYPGRPDDSLLAWCAADSLLLEEVYQRGTPGSAVLVANDAHGALCVALQPQALWTDSALAAIAMGHNARVNARIETPVVWSTQVPNLKTRLVVLRIPKQRPYLEYQLSQLARIVQEGTMVLAAGMDKHLSPHTADIFERFFGPTQRHPGQRKARLFSAIRDDRPVPTSDGASTYFCEPLGDNLHALPNVFSSEKLDIGTRFLVEQLHRLAPAGTAMDLACGNGVLGLVAMQRGLAQRMSFCDESAMALASAQRNAAHVLPQAGAHNVSFHHGDGLKQYTGEAVQLILCNPPFHQEHTVEEFLGRHLIAQCSRHIQPGGHLCLVANRHLDYAPVLRAGFRHVEKLAGNSKFNILLARKD
jgi:23S rRNA (guanine1835-N2)-methyltransferase